MSRATELLEEATPLPWVIYPAAHPGIESVAPDHPATSVVVFGHEDEEAGVQTHADADLIVYAVNRLPDYEAAVEKLRPALSLARSMILAGEPMTPNAAAVFEEAFVALARLRDKVPA